MLTGERGTLESVHIHSSYLARVKEHRMNHYRTSLILQGSRPICQTVYKVQPEHLPNGLYEVISEVKSELSNKEHSRVSVNEISIYSLHKRFFCHNLGLLGKFVQMGSHHNSKIIIYCNKCIYCLSTKNVC